MVMYDIFNMTTGENIALAYNKAMLDIIIGALSELGVNYDYYTVKMDWIKEDGDKTEMKYSVI